MLTVLLNLPGPGNSRPAGVFVFGRLCLYRETTCLENLAMSGNLTAVREMSGILPKIREISGKKSCQRKVA